MTYLWRVRKDRTHTVMHYGVLGMKWGVRKDRESKGIKTSKQTTTKGINSDKIKGSIKVYGDDMFDDYKKQFKDTKITEKTHFYMPEAVASKKLKDLPKIENRLSEDLETWRVNKNTAGDNRNSNCYQCTIAFEMRKRGYDVQSIAKDHGGHRYEYLHAFDIKDAFMVSASRTSMEVSDEQYNRERYNQIASQCLTYGEGARGSILVEWPLGGGHAMSWVVEDGEFKIIDSQRGGEDGYEAFCMAKSDIEVFRLDNAELLPGATDYVEPYKSSGKTTIKNKVNNLIKNIGKEVDALVSKGKEFVANLFKKK